MNLSKILPLLWALFSAITAHSSDSNKNVLLICIDDLRPELKSFGAEYIHSPNIDRLASIGRAFTQHYVNAPSCGPSRYTLLTGRYGPPKNDALFLRAKELQSNHHIPPSMPEWFRNHGYTTVSIGKVSHHPGGRGGKDWDDDSKHEIPNAWDKHLMPVGEWQHPRGMMHGLAHGEIRVKAGEMDLFQAVEGTDAIYPDGLIVNEALGQLEQLASEKNKPFFMAVGIIKPHLPFGAPKKYLDLYKNVVIPGIPHPDKPVGQSTWHQSGEFMKYNRWGRDPRSDEEFAIEVKRHYAACVSYADAQVGKILNKLKATGADKDTIIVLWGDHGWNLGEHAIWGKHNLFEEGLRSPMIFYYPEIADAGHKTDSVVETLDIFPTLCELTGIDIPDYVHGVSIAGILRNPNQSGHPAIGYRAGNATIRTEAHRLILHQNGFVELYDHCSPEKETVNVANENQELVDSLKETLRLRLQLKSKE